MPTKFMIIDDDQDDIELFSQVVSEIDSDIECLKESDPRCALQCLQRQDGVRPDVIFLDVNMPSLSGWEVLQSLKSNRLTTKIPVIMFSTSTHKPDIEKARQLGAVCFVVKPSIYSTLRNHIEAICASYEKGTLATCGDLLMR